MGFVQSKSTSTDGTSGTTIAVSFTGVATGNKFTAHITWGDNTAGQISSIAGGGTWTRVASTLSNDASSPQSAEQWVCENITSGGSVTVTVTFAATTPWRGLAVHEVSGTLTSSSLDKSSGQEQNATTTPQSPSVTTTAGSDYCFGGSDNSSGGNAAWAAAGSFTLREAINSLTVEQVATEDQILVSAGAINAAFTAVNANYETSLATYFASGGAPAVKPVSPVIVLQAVSRGATR